MTFRVLHAGDAAIAATDRTVIKRDDWHLLGDAIALLNEADAIRAAAASEAETMRQRAYREGLAEVHDTTAAAIAAGLDTLTTTIADELARRRSAIAEAALAATRAILGSFEDDALVDRVIDATLARLDGADALTVRVAPDVAAKLAPRPGVAIMPDPALAATQCHIVGGRGTIVASLDVQLNALAQRWGVAA